MRCTRTVATAKGKHERGVGDQVGAAVGEAEGFNVEVLGAAAANVANNLGAWCVGDGCHAGLCAMHGARHVLVHARTMCAASAALRCFSSFSSRLRALSRSRSVAWEASSPMGVCIMSRTFGFSLKWTETSEVSWFIDLGPPAMGDGRVAGRCLHAPPSARYWVATSFGASLPSSWASLLHASEATSSSAHTPPSI